MGEPSTGDERGLASRLCALLVDGQPDALVGLDADGVILLWNPAAEHLLGYSASEAIGQLASRLFPAQDEGLLERAAASDDDRLTREMDVVRKDGRRAHVNVTLTVLRGEDGALAGFAASARAAGPAAATTSPLDTDPCRGLAESSTMGIITLDDRSDIVYANPGTERIFGYRREELIGKNLTQLMPPEFRQRHLAGFSRFLATGERHVPWDGFELVALTKDGHEVPIHVTLSDFMYEGRHYFSAGISDMSERKRIERQLQHALRRLQLEKEQIPLAVIDWDTSLRVVAWNPTATLIFGYTSEEAVGQRIGFLSPERERAQDESSLRGLLDRQGDERVTLENVTKDGRIVYCEWSNAAVVDDGGRPLCGVSFVQDVTASRDAEAQVRQQVERLHALRTIDLAITASFDLEVTLTVLLDLVIAQLGVDAADVLLLHPYTNRLEYGAGRGFRTEAVQQSELRLGEGSAGRAALDRRTVIIPNLRASREFARAELLAAEDFEVHASTPLIAKGKVVGVLEVFHRAPLRPEPDWFAFLETLAGQSAIAVESARLFADLERSNLELILAYDTTLEGWAQALDLRDAVTEGHSRRVTEMTLRLAEKLGVGDQELADMRRGALLHDIGKIAIPDGILNKQGPLTDEEWAIMRRHPEYAFRFLQPIDYLRPAIDIPYAHHEHWDGSGYPRGLREQAIPLAARIFAVVDVWDALTTARPYHDAWTPDQARREIAKMSGTKLDPQVVDVFLSMDW